MDGGIWRTVQLSSQRPFIPSQRSHQPQSIPREYYWCYPYHKNYQQQFDEQYPMKKIPIQLLVDTVSLIGILLFVFWTSHGGLKGEIAQLFQLQATEEHARDKVSHCADLLFYYAGCVGVIVVGLAGLTFASSRFKQLEGLLPNYQQSLALLLELVQNLVIFMGIYIYLLHKDGAGLKKQKLLLFPFWFLVTIVLDMLGKAVTAAQRKVNGSSAGFYLRVISFGLMLAQLGGYKPFTLI